MSWRGSACSSPPLPTSSATSATGSTTCLTTASAASNSGGGTSTVYPMAGALLGTFVGGPVGLLAGVKIGGLAAIGGSIFGKFSPWIPQLVLLLISGNEVDFLCPDLELSRGCSRGGQVQVGPIAGPPESNFTYFTLHRKEILWATSRVRLNFCYYLHTLLVEITNKYLHLCDYKNL